MKRFFILIMMVLIVVPALICQDQKKLNYEMSIKAVSIPVFAVDRKGHPVHNLNKEEIEVYLNGQRINFFLNRKTFADSARQTLTTDQPAPIPRLIYICFDTIFNNRSGIKKGKEIARELIKNSNNIDKFVILKFSIKKGISLIGGPLEKSPELFKLIEGIKPKTAVNPNKFFKSNIQFSKEHGLFDDRDIDNLQVYSGESNTPIDNQLVRAEEVMKNLSSNSYNVLIKIFASILSRMEYLLKTVNQPKLVFLLSYGMNLEGEVITRSESMKKVAPQTDREEDIDNKAVVSLKKEKTQKDTRVFSQLFKNYIEQIALAINNGGSLLFTINPLNSDSGAAALKSMAEASGGKYYARNNLKKIVEEIHQDISAYYEISFQLEDNINNPIALRYACNRKGVQIKSIKSLRKLSQFFELNRTQKRAYLLDSFINNRWSRYFANSKLVPFKEKLIKENSYEYQVPLENLGVIGKDIETYLVSTIRGQNNFQFNVSNKIADKKETFNLKKDKDRIYFFVIVNLKDSVCYYNKI